MRNSESAALPTPANKWNAPHNWGEKSEPAATSPEFIHDDCGGVPARVTERSAHSRSGRRAAGLHWVRGTLGAAVCPPLREGWNQQQRQHTVPATRGTVLITGKVLLCMMVQVLHTESLVRRGVSYLTRHTQRGAGFRGSAAPLVFPRPQSVRSLPQARADQRCCRVSSATANAATTRPSMLGSMIVTL